MNGFHYPSRIADDSDNDELSINSAEIEGVVAAVTTSNGENNKDGDDISNESGERGYEAAVVPAPPAPSAVPQSTSSSSIGTPSQNNNHNGTPRSGGVKKSRPWLTPKPRDDCDDDHSSSGEEQSHDAQNDDELEISRHGGERSKSGSRASSPGGTFSASSSSGQHEKNDLNKSTSTLSQKELERVEKDKHMAYLIENERQRRLGARNYNSNNNNNNSNSNTDATTTATSSADAEVAAQANQNNEGGILRGIRGWFAGSGAGGGGADTYNNEKATHKTRRASTQAISSQSNSMNNSRHGGKNQPQQAQPPLKSARNGQSNHHLLPIDKSKSAKNNTTTTNNNNNNKKEESTTSSSSEEEDDDSSSSSSDSSSSDSSSDWSANSPNNNNPNKTSNNNNTHYRITPQERARIRALRYLSNSCVDAGRKAKTSSYIRGLERLDLKRKRDRYEKELDVVESEMNKDRVGSGSVGAIGSSKSRVGRIGEEEELYGDEGEGVDMQDVVTKMAFKLVRELPILNKGMMMAGGEKEGDVSSGADAGAGKPTPTTASKRFMTYEEYADALNEHEDSIMDSISMEEDPGHPSKLWENKECVDIYVGFLQRRFKEALEKTRSLEKRLAVLEQTGDEIVSSLCEDLVDIMEHSNKTEARYVKKGKELQRKRRREEIRHNDKVKQAESRIRKLEARLVTVSGEGGNDSSNVLDESDTSRSDSDSESDDEENDEVRLERKLASIKAKSEEDKAAHQSEVDSIRRQCEQLKLRLSVARLVMEGDDNLREYIAVLDRLNPSVQQQRHSKSSRKGSYDDYDFSGIHRSAIPPPPPSRITRARAKLLKATHLEHIYTQRLAVIKAFTDATINALEQELSEREESGQKMEVRCLNELMAIDSEMKDIVKEASDKMAELEAEAKQLEEAIVACCAEKGIDYDFDDEVMVGSVILNEIEPTTASDKDEVITKGKSLGEKMDDGDEEEDNSTSDSESRVAASKHRNERKILNRQDADGSQLESDVKCSQKEKSDTGSAEKVISAAVDIDTLSIDEQNVLHHNASAEDGKVEANKSVSSQNADRTAYNAKDHELPRSEKEQQSSDASASSPAANSSSKDRNTTINNNSKNESELSKPPSQSSNGNGYASKEDENSLNALHPQQKAVLELLGRELSCTLADYQTSFDLSSSRERIQQLDYMNNVVLKIAKVRGLKIAPKPDMVGDGIFKSWSLKPKPDRAESEDVDKSFRREKKRSKKKKKKKKHHRNEKREKSEKPISLKEILQKGNKNEDQLEEKNVFITTRESLVW